ncbi:hypothetical protein ACPCK9_26390 [Streptomyces koyangensis]|uniref:hypothetical protein n=1 Tax=Streptomyces koyangensis TaxID=188770 RepID=UPI003C2E8D57
MTQPTPIRREAPPWEAVRWLHIVAPASARSWCQCGFERTARDRAGVPALIAAHTAHAAVCPLSHPEGSKAA